MAILKKRQLRELSADDLQKRLAELKLEMAKEKSQIAIGGAAANPGKLSQTRKTIAKILTEIKRRRTEMKEKEVKKPGSM